MGKALFGKQIAADIMAEVAAKVAKLDKKPVLAGVIVGEDPASQVYIKNKNRACEKTGIGSETFIYPDDITEEDLLKRIEELNNNPDITGILLQLPLPKHIKEVNILKAMDPKKDVDGFNPINVGLLSTGSSETLKPCTPHGAVRLLQAYGYEIAGKHCVVIGRSNIVGKPAAALLLRENGTVTICHSKTKNLADITRQADIIVVTIGVPRFLKADMVKPGAVILDVGINSTPEGLCGDADYDAILPICDITPVPGGLGVMTNAMLMENCLTAYEMQHE